MASSSSPIKEAGNILSPPPFKFIDFFNIPLGIIEGSLGAIKSKSANFLCSTNTTATRKNLLSMNDKIELGQTSDAVTEFYRALQRTDDITINCGNAILTNSDIFNVFNGVGDTYKGETFVTNILYNLGFQFTDILDLIFIDPENKEPFWYYVFYRVGDFMIRFMYKDTTM